MPVSSRKTRRVGSQVGAAACHTTRAAATSGRSCSEGRTVFFDGHVQSRHRAPDRRQTGRRAERVLQLGTVRSGCSAISAARVCRCGSNIRRRPCRWTRGATSPVSRRRSAAPTTRSRGTSPQRPRPSSRHHCRAGPVLGDPSNRLASPPALVHAEVPRRAQAKGYLKSALGILPAFRASGHIVAAESGTEFKSHDQSTGTRCVSSSVQCTRTLRSVCVLVTALVLERHLDLGAIGFDLAVLDIHIEGRDFSDP